VSPLKSQSGSSSRTSRLFFVIFAVKIFCICTAQNEFS
jgi:hypothetical protein